MRIFVSACATHQNIVNMTHIEHGVVDCATVTVREAIAIPEHKVKTGLVRIWKL